MIDFSKSTARFPEDDSVEEWIRFVVQSVDIDSKKKPFPFQHIGEGILLLTINDGKLHPDLIKAIFAAKRYVAIENGDIEYEVDGNVIRIDNWPKT